MSSCPHTLCSTKETDLIVINLLVVIEILNSSCVLKLQLTVSPCIHCCYSLSRAVPSVTLLLSKPLLKFSNEALNVYRHILWHPHPKKKKIPEQNPPLIKWVSHGIKVHASLCVRQAAEQTVSECSFFEWLNANKYGLKQNIWLGKNMLWILEMIPSFFSQ